MRRAAIGSTDARGTSPPKRPEIAPEEAPMMAKKSASSSKMMQMVARNVPLLLL